MDEATLETYIKQLVESSLGPQLPTYCKECPVLFACYGECPRNRFIKTPDGEQGLNYLCAGYKAFFTHIDPSMKTMSGLIKQGRFADEIMGAQTPG